MLKLLCVLLSLQCEIPPKKGDPCSRNADHLSSKQRIDFEIGCSTVRDRQALRNSQIEDILNGLPEVQERR
jgi:hypothetical protein